MLQNNLLSFTSQIPSPVFLLEREVLSESVHKIFCIASALIPFTCKYYINNILSYYVMAFKLNKNNLATDTSINIIFRIVFGEFIDDLYKVLDLFVLSVSTAEVE